jgi:hypothetical protein
LEHLRRSCQDATIPRYSTRKDLNLLKGSLTVSLYEKPRVVYGTGQRPRTTSHRLSDGLAAGVSRLSGYRPVLMALTVGALHLLLWSVFIAGNGRAAPDTPTETYPFEVFFLSQPSGVVESPVRADPRLQTTFHLPELSLIHIEEQARIPATSVAITIPAADAPRRPSATGPGNDGSVLSRCLATPIHKRVGPECKTM